ncbi:MAG: NTP transferase domain-containing protein [Sedimentibacter sp.]
MNISAIVMASGLSKRMGKDKLHLEINNKKIYEYVMETIEKYNFYETIVAAKDDDIIKKAESLRFLGVKNPKYFLGQSESIKAALENSKQTDGYMFFVADQPFITISTIEKLCNEFKQNPKSIVVPFYNGTRGNPVIFPSEIKNQLMALENDNGGKAVINNNQDRVLKVHIETKDEYIDIDTYDDYELVKNMKVVE